MKSTEKNGEKSRIFRRHGNKKEKEILKLSKI